VNYIGVDVDSKYLVCQIQRSGKKYPMATFDNTEVGHRKFIRWATKYSKPAKVCMEATGVYYLLFSLALHQSKNIEVMVMNPRAIKNFATASLQRGKTDAMDAAVILEFLLRMPFRLWQPPSEDILEIQYISRRIVHLNANLTRERNRHHAASKTGSIGRLVVNDTQVCINHYERRIKIIEENLVRLMESIPELNDRLTIITSVTGIARKTGPRLIAELSTLPGDMKGPQWVAQAGLDPRPFESGTSTDKPRRITKAGNRYLREALYFPALVASRRDPNVRAFYEMLLAKGKKPMQAIVAIMRKLLLAIWGMFKNNEIWNGEKFYALKT
jgi:transposase